MASVQELRERIRRVDQMVDKSLRDHWKGLKQKAVDNAEVELKAAEEAAKKGEPLRAIHHRIRAEILLFPFQ